MTTHLLVVGLLVMVTNGCLTPLSTLSPLRPPSHTPQLERHANKRAETWWNLASLRLRLYQTGSLLCKGPMID